MKYRNKQVSLLRVPLSKLAQAKTHLSRILDGVVCLGWSIFAFRMLYSRRRDPRYNWLGGWLDPRVKSTSPSGMKAGFSSVQRAAQPLCCSCAHLTFLSFLLYMACDANGKQRTLCFMSLDIPLRLHCSSEPSVLLWSQCFLSCILLYWLLTSFVLCISAFHIHLFAVFRT